MTSDSVIGWHLVRKTWTACWWFLLFSLGSMWSTEKCLSSFRQNQLKSVGQLNPKLQPHSWHSSLDFYSARQESDEVSTSLLKIHRSSLDLFQLFDERTGIQKQMHCAASIFSNAFQLACHARVFSTTPPSRQQKQTLSVLWFKVVLRLRDLHHPVSN